MDNKFDIIIYLIIAFGGLIANAYRGYAKRKEQERKNQHPHEAFPDSDYEENAPHTHPFPDFETIFDIPKQSPVIIAADIDEDEEDAKMEPIAVPIVAGNVDEKEYASFSADSVENTESYDYNKDQIAFNDEAAKSMEESSPIYKSAIDEQMEGVLKDFDPSLAIIYSEILKRPEY